jgi:hypothetical protein
LKLSQQINELKSSREISHFNVELETNISKISIIRVDIDIDIDPDGGD